MKVGDQMKKIILLSIAVLLTIIVINTDKIEYSYKLSSHDANEKNISLECYRTKIMNYQILVWGNVSYDQVSYYFNFVRWSNFPLSRSARLKIFARRIEDSEYLYTPWIRINKNFKEINIIITMADKSSGRTSSKIVEASKISE